VTRFRVDAWPPLCTSSGVDLEAQEPLHDGERQADQVQREVEGEAVFELVVKAGGRDRVGDGLVQVGLVGDSRSKP